MKTFHLCRSLMLLALVSVSAISTPITAQTVRKIVYIRTTSTLTAELWIMNPDGSGQTKVCNCSGVQRPVLSPDNLKIAFEMSGNIYVVNTDGTGLRNLTQNGNYNEYASWSPDSTQIIFDNDHRDIYRVNIDGSNTTRLTNSGESNVLSSAAAAWSPDGRKIAFTGSGSEGGMYLGSEIWVMNSGGARQLGGTRLLRPRVLLISGVIMHVGLAVWVLAGGTLFPLMVGLSFTALWSFLYVVRLTTEK